MIDRHTVIANPVSRSKSPLIHAAFVCARPDGTGALANAVFASMRGTP
ncbi:MAG: hypothetical protein WBM28_00860 [Burkholderiales bacterium]